MPALNNDLVRLIKNSDIESIVGKRCSPIETSGFTTMDFIEHTNRCRSISDIDRICHAIRCHHGFDFFALFVRVQRINMNPLCFLLREYEDAWTLHYESNNYMINDPTIRLATGSVTPFIWSSHLFENVSHLLLPNEFSISHDALDFGLRDIFNAPFRGQDGGYGLVRFINKSGGQTSTKERIENQFKIPELYYISSHIYESLANILRHNSLAQPLSDREREVLMWTAQGKNPAAISDLLKISDNTVNKHLGNIRTKLSVKNTTHAVAKAIASKVISI